MRIGRSAIRLGFAPHVIRLGEIAEGSVIGICAATVAVLLFGLLWQDLQMQSLLPSGAVSLSLQTSLSGVLLTLIMGSSAGAIIYSWRRSMHTQFGN